MNAEHDNSGGGGRRGRPRRGGDRSSHDSGRTTAVATQPEAVATPAPDAMPAIGQATPPPAETPAAVAKAPARTTPESAPAAAPAAPGGVPELARSGVAYISEMKRLSI